MKKILTAYFSMHGETWADGKIVPLEKGYTESAAEMIQEAVGGDLFRIEQTRKYASDHFEMIQQAKEEYQNKARPALKKYCENLNDYDVIFLGFPNWWGTLPMPVLTFVEHGDWSGKRVIPFVTSGGSGFGNAIRDLKKSIPEASIDGNGFAVKGTQVEKSTAEIKAWAKSRV